MRIAFHTANYFARSSNYQTSFQQWGIAERRVIENFSLAEFDRICADIAKAGFTYIELWMAHAFPKFMTPYLADELKMIWQQHGLTVISYSCSLGDPIRSPRWTRLCFETCKMLGIDLITSGISKNAAPIISSLCRDYRIKVAVENHDEKHPNEIKEIIDGFDDWLGACVDTGWFETQGFPAHEAIWQLKDHLFHIHLKDVKEIGAHNTTALGNGIVNVSACIQALREINYNRSLSIEHESGDHDPTEDCANGLQLVYQLLGN
ncbi:sugar phosphate isomerase/epimerase [Parageobacillus sp. VR-IP]|uniref:sugar phosphate isomerase/epimerase family protein n=1 Tax=Parageobacillus sp. VR-IP TaxID=2742205 RepID=UPI001583AAEC|nr:sugar phosphate isomerase/epimerase family protein [Parageobacillus sp. VR-IP]NUK30253.1 sugar phosphate isomerase/epimerase [Parageobacillus sp. VR-IP]